MIESGAAISLSLLTRSVYIQRSEKACYVTSINTYELNDVSCKKMHSIHYLWSGEGCWTCSWKMPYISEAHLLGSLSELSCFHYTVYGVVLYYRDHYKGCYPVPYLLSKIPQGEVKNNKEWGRHSNLSKEQYCNIQRNNEPTDMEKYCIVL